MKAILIDTPGDESALRLGEAEAPCPGPDDLHIRVRATAANRADLLQRQGLYAPPAGASPILGLEHGADRAFDYRRADFSERVLEATNGRGVDVLLDCIGGSYLASNVSSLAFGAVSW